MSVVPGSSKIILGSAGKGMFIMSVAAGAVFMLIWNGFYLHDPRSAGSAAPLMQQAAAAVIIALCWLSTFRSRKPREQINYRILPQDYRVEKPEKKKPAGRESLNLGSDPANTPDGALEQPERRRFTEQDNKAQEAFKDYLETL